MQSTIFLFLTIGSLFEFISGSPDKWNSSSMWRQKSRVECRTEVTPKQIRAERERRARGDFNARLAPQANRPYHIALTIHIVRRDDGTGGFGLEDLQAAMLDLNRLWLPSGIQFFQHGAVDYINSTYHSDIPDSQARRDELRAVNSVANTINVYFTNLTDLCGQSTFTTSSTQGVLMDNGCAGVGNSPSTFAHEIGHYFDLITRTRPSSERNVRAESIVRMPVI